MFRQGNFKDHQQDVDDSGYESAESFVVAKDWHTKMLEEMASEETRKAAEVLEAKETILFERLLRRHHKAERKFAAREAEYHQMDDQETADLLEREALLALQQDEFNEELESSHEEMDAIFDEEATDSLHQEYQKNLEDYYANLSQEQQSITYLTPRSLIYIKSKKSQLTLLKLLI
ncbi:MAG: hypothetical protein P4M14_01820 [Gammaproteobacteria bacterium]|nr:hypothetical protein [Gammaproteobacteria bacterium]